MNSIVEVFRSFVLRKTPIKNMFVHLYYHEKIHGKKLKGKILKLIGNFQMDLSEKKSWNKIKKDFGELMIEIEILVKVLTFKDEKPKDIEDKLKQMVGEKEDLIGKEEKNYDYSFDSTSKFLEKIVKVLKEVMNLNKRNVNENEDVDWPEIRSCTILKFRTLSTQESTTLLRTKREDPVFLYHNRRYSVRASNVFNYISWYLILGGSLWLGSSVGVLRIVAALDPHCPVPVIHLSEMHLPEIHFPAMHMSELLRRRQNSPNIPTHTQFQPQPSNPNRANVQPEVVWGYPVPREQVRNPIGQIHDGFLAQQYQHRYRRNAKGTQKECQLNRGSCPNSFFISFHKDDSENSLFSVKENECFKNFENIGDKKIRKKRDVFEIEWVECGNFIFMFWFVGVFVAWVVGAVFIGIHYF